MVNKPLNIPVRKIEGGARLGEASSEEVSLSAHVHIPDATAVADAADLMSRYGGFAADEAGARASRSRDLGNVIHYCRWRQIQRLIELLEAGEGESTLH